MSKPNREKAFQSLLQEMRRFIANAVLFNDQLAQQLGVNSTDYQVLNLLDLRGSAKPGELARLTGLTTGGITLALDRLETAEFARRERNPHDRRSVIVRPVPAKMHKISQLYKPVIAAMQSIAAGYSSDDLGVIADFFGRANASRAKAEGFPAA